MTVEIHLANTSLMGNLEPIPELLSIDRKIGRPYLDVPRVYNSQAWSRRLELPWTVARIGEVDGNSILDIGSGISALPIYLSGRGAVVVSVDPASERLLENEGLTRVRAGLPRLPFRDKSFDFVTCISVLEHLNVDVDVCLSEMCRLARKRVVVTFDVALGPLSHGGLSKLELGAVARLLGKRRPQTVNLVVPGGEERKVAGPQIGVCLVSGDITELDLDAGRLSRAERLLVHMYRSYQRIVRTLRGERPELVHLASSVQRLVTDQGAFGHAMGTRHRQQSIGKREQPTMSPVRLAIEWLASQESPLGAIRTHSRNSEPYPEVTGYLIPTLIRYGELGMAKRFLAWLTKIQAADGSYTGLESLSYPFDTAQVLRGLLAGQGLASDALECARRAADYLVGEMVEGGSGGFGVRYSGSVPASVHLYALPPLFRAAEVFKSTTYQSAATRCFDFYSHHPQALRVKGLTHYLGYELEAMIDLGRRDLATPALNTLSELQLHDGSVRGEGDSRWVCTPGLAQLAVCWYKIGATDQADRALAWLEAHQKSDGGFRGSEGPGSSYFPDAEIPWTTKFYLDAHLMRVKSFFDRKGDIVDGYVASSDARARTVLETSHPGTAILEIGCGKGRYLDVIRRTHPRCRLYGVDLVRDYLTYLPREIAGISGCMELLPFRNGAFDLVFAVEALEHSPNPNAVVKEVIRVARPGAKVLIIDKESSAWGQLECPPWEFWPDRDELIAQLGKTASEVSTRPIGDQGDSSVTGIMISWTATKQGEVEH